jgi:uncharacterized membrane protein YqjE
MADAAPRGILGSARAIFTTVVKIVSLRAELVFTELQEERERIFPILVYALATAFLLGLGFFFLTVFTVLVFWENYRLQVLGSFIGLYFFGGLAAAWKLRRLLMDRPRLLSASLHQIKKDLQGLRTSTH